MATDPSSESGIEGTRQLLGEAYVHRAHLDRLSNQTGSDGEKQLIDSMDDLIPRPKGDALKVLLTELERTGISIAKTSFDAILLPSGRHVDFGDIQDLRESLSEMTFVEIKSTKKTSVKEDFSGYFFSLTEKEIDAAQQLGPRHIVLLHNTLTGHFLQTSVSELAQRSRSTTWQVSVQLGPLTC
ncbi:MAG: hypothetical protein GY708_21520 [Actinomycetia bacterium]|nr:hypothetical protein [Actinomycetes bacterium]